jgi:hypothetical protein
MAWKVVLFAAVADRGGSTGKPRPWGRPALVQEVVAIIERMARKNPTWSRRRIADELAKLGHGVSKDTVAKYMPKSRVGLVGLGRRRGARSLATALREPRYGFLDRARAERTKARRVRSHYISI